MQMCDVIKRNFTSSKFFVSEHSPPAMLLFKLLLINTAKINKLIKHFIYLKRGKEYITEYKYFSMLIFRVTDYDRFMNTSDFQSP